MFKSLLRPHCSRQGHPGIPNRTLSGSMKAGPSDAAMIDEVCVDHPRERWVRQGNFEWNVIVWLRVVTALETVSTDLALYAVFKVTQRHARSSQYQLRP